MKFPSFGKKKEALISPQPPRFDEDNRRPGQSPTLAMDPVDRKMPRSEFDILRSEQPVYERILNQVAKVSLRGRVIEDAFEIFCHLDFIEGMAKALTESCALSEWCSHSVEDLEVMMLHAASRDPAYFVRIVSVKEALRFSSCIVNR